LVNSLYAYDPPEVNVRDPPEMYIFMDVYDPPQVCVHDLPEVYVYNPPVMDLYDPAEYISMILLMCTFTIILNFT
jgi:hypothetical protein